MSMRWMVMMGFVLATAPLVYAQEAPATRARSSGPARDHGFISAGVGVQQKAGSFSETWTTPLHAEDARFSARYAPGSGRLFRVGGGVTLWRGLGVRVAVNSASPGADVALSGSLPHPFRFDDARTIEGTRPGFTRAETGVHVHAAYVLPTPRRIHASVFAGPSWISIRQELVDRVTYEDSYPYDTATFTGAVSTSVSTRRGTVGVGAAVYVGVLGPVHAGVEVLHARATVAVDRAGDRRVETRAGGTQVTVGVLVPF